MKTIIGMALLFFIVGPVSGASKKVAKAEDCVEESKGLVGDLEAVAKKVKVCPDPSKISGLCSLLSLKVKDSDPNSSFTFLYERKIYEASCADYENDSEEVIAKKVSSMFSKFEASLKCNQPDFDISQGNILKYAINTKTFGFINNAVEEWKVNLNVTDPKDNNETVLDYVQKQIDRNKGLPLELTLQGYYKKLRNAGAKHKSELKT